ncbi:MAG: hypothetical protein GY786_16105 [Proteobacteria bacterium]|nr:hypothetical protein [Pseudomonadota bacterium]
MKNGRTLLIVADCHLGVKSNDVDRMITFIESKDPKKDELLFLGDLFHIWAGPENYHVPEVTNLLKAIERYTALGGRVHLNVGNRDIFFTETNDNGKKNHLPFTTITCDFFQIVIKGKKLLAIHGDTVNKMDSRYLRWRRLVRSKLFRGFFNLLPNERVKKIMFNLESKLKNTNLDFRLEFPKEQWENFIIEVHEKYNPELLLVGHFHPNQMIESTYKSTTGMVIPDWHSNHSYLSIDSDLNTELLQFI